jgi:nucleotide-binding universal stress UspA family protein
MFKTILVPTDASESAQRALMIAIDLAKQFGSRILLLHVVYTPEALGC